MIIKNYLLKFYIFNRLALNKILKSWILAIYTINRLKMENIKMI
jgi:hypothetical protein